VWAWDGWQETEAGIRLSTVKRRLGEGPPLAISFPVAAAFRELSSDAMAAAFHPSAPLAPPAAASGTAPSAAGLSSVLAVLNKSEHAVALVDTDTLAVVRRVPTGVAPHEAAVSRDGRTLYVANYGGARPGDSLTVIDLPSGEVSRTVSLGEHTRPHGLAVGPDGSLWVTAEGSGSLLRLSPADLSVAARYATGQEVSHMVALSPDGARAFVTSITTGSVTAVDAASGEVRSVATGAGAEGIDVTPDGLEVWVAHREADDLAILDAATLEVKGRVSTGAFPIRVKVTPDGARVLVSCAESEELLVFDRAERRQVGHVALPSAPIGIQLTPDGRRAFVAATGADEVAVVDLERLAVTATIRPGDEPDGMAFASW
jgi:YVTN family beta-propeller protein